jgi:hypothetical protein
MKCSIFFLQHIFNLYSPQVCHRSVRDDPRGRDQSREHKPRSRRRRRRIHVYGTEPGREGDPFGQT